MGEPGSAVDQNALHFSSAYTRGEVLVLVAGDVGEVGVAGPRKRQPALKSGAMRPVGAASLFVRQPFVERTDELLAFLRGKPPCPLEDFGHRLHVGKVSPLLFERQRS